MTKGARLSYRITRLYDNCMRANEAGNDDNGTKELKG